MKLLFCLSALALVAAAAALLLRPLLRARSHATAWALGVSLPLATAGLYLALGMPAALDGLPRQAAADAGTDTDTPEALLAQAQAYDQASRPDAARETYARLLELAPGDIAAMLGWVQADMAQHSDLAIGEPGRRMLEQVLAREPDNQRGLWLLGISDFQRGDYAGAGSTWRRLRQQLEAGSALEQAVAGKIASAEALAHARERPPAPD